MRNNNERHTIQIKQFPKCSTIHAIIVVKRHTIIEEKSEFFSHQILVQHKPPGISIAGTNLN